MLEQKFKIQRDEVEVFMENCLYFTVKLNSIHRGNLFLNLAINIDIYDLPFPVH